MATSITLKNIPEHVYNSLRAAADAHHRSLNGEIIACLEQSLLPAKSNAHEHLAKARELRQTLAPYRFTADEIASTIKEGRE
jgi:antitoxin FitA